MGAIEYKIEVDLTKYVAMSVNTAQGYYIEIRPKSSERMMSAMEAKVLENVLNGVFKDDEKH